MHTILSQAAGLRTEGPLHGILESCDWGLFLWLLKSEAQHPPKHPHFLILSNFTQNNTKQPVKGWDSELPLAWPSVA